MDIWHWILAVLLLILATPYLVGPFVVWKQSSLPCRYIFHPVDPERWLEGAEGAALRFDAELRSLGFAPAVAARLSDAEGPDGVLLYATDTDPCSASIVVASNAKATEVMVDLSQRFASGIVLSLTNGTLPNAFPPRKNHRVYQLPGHDDVSELVRRFRALRRTVGEGSPIRLPEGEELGTAQEEMDGWLDEMCRAGYASSQCHGDRRPFTLKGALLGTWSLLWPMKQLALSRNRARTLRASRE